MIICNYCLLNHSDNKEQVIKNHYIDLECALSALDSPISLVIIQGLYLAIYP